MIRINNIKYSYISSLDQQGIIYSDNCMSYINYKKYIKILVKKIQNIIRMSIGYCFNKKPKIPITIKFVNIMYNCNKRIKIPRNVTHLSFEDGTNIIQKIPQHITHLHIAHFNHKMKIPQNIIYIRLNYLFNTEIKIKIPQNIKKIKIYKHQTKSIVPKKHYFCDILYYVKNT